MIQTKLILHAILGVLLLTACQSEDNIDENKEPPVTENPVFTIEPESIILAVGESCQLVAKLDGVPVEEGQVRWESNSSLVGVDNGKVTAISYNEFISGLSVSAKMQGGFYAICKVAICQEYNYKLRIVLKDKGTADVSLNLPEQFLSVKAIERRNKRNIAIDESDLPISKAYLEQIKKVGGTIVSQSKWLKTVCVQCEDKNLIDEYMKLPFVEDVLMVWRGERGNQKPETFSFNSSMNRDISNYYLQDYGKALSNISLHQGQILHERGFRGSGIDIAVIDAGFINLPDNPTLSDIQIKGAKSFIYEDANPFNTDSHGVWVTA